MLEERQPEPPLVRELHDEPAAYKRARYAYRDPRKQRPT
jgi:hypothetical protein